MVIVCSRFDTAVLPLLLLVPLLGWPSVRPSFAPCTRALAFTTASATVLSVVRPSLPPFFLFFSQPAQAAQVRLSLLILVGQPAHHSFHRRTPSFTPLPLPLLSLPHHSAGPTPPLPDDDLPPCPLLPSHPHLLLHLPRKPSRPFHPRPSKRSPPSFDASGHRAFCFEEQGAFQGGRRRRRSRRQTPLLNDGSRERGEKDC